MSLFSLKCSDDVHVGADGFSDLGIGGGGGNRTGVLKLYIILKSRMEIKKGLWPNRPKPYAFELVEVDLKSVRYNFMAKKTQKDFVFETVKDVLGDLYSPNESMRKYFDNFLRIQAVVDRFVEAVNSSKIDRPKNCEHNDRLRTYARRITFDRLNKDKRLNGGTRYKPKRIGVEEAINSDRIISNLRGQIHHIKTKGVTKGWGRHRGIVRVLKEGFELSAKDLAKIKKLENEISERKKILQSFGSLLPEISKCTNDSSTIAYVKLLTDLNNFDHCMLVVEALIHHILTFAEPIEESKNAS